MLDHTLLHLPGHHLPRPHDNCYWLVPGRIMAGEYPRTATESESRAKIAGILAAGIRQFIDLTEPSEPLAKYDRVLAAEAERSAIASHHARFPIRDLSVPPAAYMVTILRAIHSAYVGGLPVYVHCWGGIGRTGTVVGCLLVESGITGDDALALIAHKWTVMAKRHYRPRSPETDEQVAYVRHWAVTRNSLDDCGIR